MLSLPIVQLDPDLPLPAYAHHGDAGLDLRAREDAVVTAGGGRTLVPTGIAIAIPLGYAGFVLPRSGLALKHGLGAGTVHQVDDAGLRLSTSLDDLRCRGRSTLGLQVETHGACALRARGERTGLADPAARANHRHDPAVESKHVGSHQDA